MCQHHCLMSEQPQSEGNVHKINAVRGSMEGSCFSHDFITSQVRRICLCIKLILNCALLILKDGERLTDGRI